MDTEHHHREQEQDAEVAVVTTSGRYPTTGENRVPEHQPVEHELRKAKEALKIVDTAGWVARADGREVDPAKSYAENHLAGKVVIDWGPNHGGGGNA
jgi:hypothetical protein